jgi:hypothetical protein
MAIGKNKKGKKGGRKKVIEPMTRKDWYDVQVPATFANRKMGKTLVNRTAGLSKLSCHQQWGVVLLGCLRVAGVQRCACRVRVFDGQEELTMAVTTGVPESASGGLSAAL